MINVRGTSPKFGWGQGKWFYFFTIAPVLVRIRQGAIYVLYKNRVVIINPIQINNSAITQIHNPYPQHERWLDRKDLRLHILKLHIFQKIQPLQTSHSFTLFYKEPSGTIHHLPWQNKLFWIRFFAVAAIFTALCMQTAGVDN